jgi:Ser/Thr protein kinase RdoA (MazF antagonist)
MTPPLTEALNRHYLLHFDRLEFLRDGGNTSYAAFAGGQKYFLRAIKPAFAEGARRGAEIQLFLHRRGFPVPRVVLTEDGAPWAEDGGRLFLLYEYIEGVEADPARDAGALGALVGRLHREMEDYPGPLLRREKYYYIDKYIEILRAKQYPKADEFAAYGEALWARVKDLPRGYCHGDMYRGNFHKTPSGELCVLDFDTSCEGFPMYDPALACDLTNYFKFQRQGYGRSRRVFERFLPAYLQHNPLAQIEIDAFFDLVAVYHFALQATIIELHGLDCVDDKFLDDQLNWLYRWQKQCGKRR